MTVPPAHRDKENLRKLPLHEAHEAEGAQFIEYAGWLLPLLYVSIIAEHQQVRMRAGLSDLSYMGKIEIAGSERHKLLERHSSRAIDGESLGRVYYSLMLTPEATIFADILVFVRENSYILTLNPLTTGKVLERFQEGTKELDVQVKDRTAELALLSVQGRKAPMTLQRITDAVLSDILNNRFCEAFVVGKEAIVARTSYSGEDGFEILIENDAAQELWYKLLDVGQSEQIVPVGVGARNTLRLEATFPLYGSELSDGVNPLEADLAYAANSRADYVGKEELEKLRKKGVKRKLCGLVINARVVAREGFDVLSEGKAVGHITRGIPSPTLRRRIALAYLPVELSVPGTEVEVEVRGKNYPAVVTRKPFYLRKQPVRRI